jgi:hypothetical protein
VCSGGPVARMAAVSGCDLSRGRGSFSFAGLLTLAALVSASAATFQEDFANDPLAHGWRIFGESNLFHWNSTNQNLEVTWDSSHSNSYLQLPIGTILTRYDDFSFEVDLRLDDVAAGVSPGKPGTMELAFGFQNWVDAQKTNFFRATGRGSANLAEFDYFPQAGSIQPTVWPAMWSTNSVLSYNGPSDFTLLSLPLGVVMRVSVAYTASNQTMAASITTNGISVGAVHSAKISTNFTDFRAGIFAIESYSEAGQSGFGQGSILAHGVIDNVLLDVPPSPVQNLQESFTGGSSQVQFVSRTNWVYTLERTINLRDWTDASVTSIGTGADLFLQDTNPAGANMFYRVRAERP